MQRARADRFKRIIKIGLPIAVIVLAILFDQLTKLYFRNNVDSTDYIWVIPNFFYLTYTVNTGAAWSFLSDVAWSQTFFKVLTCIALVVWILFLIYSYRKGYKWLCYSLALVIAGTVGNFIDRLIFNGVTDFLGFIFGNYYFPVFNLADSFLVVGVVMIIIHYLFLDDNKVFVKKQDNDKKAEEKSDKNGN